MVWLYGHTFRQDVQQGVGPRTGAFVFGRNADNMAALDHRGVDAELCVESGEEQQ